MTIRRFDSIIDSNGNFRFAGLYVIPHLLCAFAQFPAF